MDMKKINSGKLRAIGYDGNNRVLQVQLDDGSTFQYSGVGEDTWRRLSSSVKWVKWGQTRISCATKWGS